MSPWTAFLESLHSALIDEITERHSEPKPELGLPLRQNRFAVPSSEVEQLLLVEVACGTSPGIALLAQAGFMKAIRLSPQDLWNAIVQRAETEFSRRGIEPRFSAAQKL